MSQQIHFIIDSRLEEVSLVGISIKAICLHYSLPGLVAFKIGLCVDEMLNNVIEHTYRFETGHSIRISLKLLASRMEILIRYRSEPLPEGTHLRSVFSTEKADQLPERGFGHFLVHQIMDKIAYHHEGGENQLFMAKDLPASSNLHP